MQTIAGYYHYNSFRYEGLYVVTFLQVLTFILLPCLSRPGLEQVCGLRHPLGAFVLMPVLQFRLGEYALPHRPDPPTYSDMNGYATSPPRCSGQSRIGSRFVLC
jgi:hypothetical protein